MKHVDISIADVKFNVASRLQCMHGCMHYNKSPMCPPACPDIHEMKEMIAAYKTARFVYEVVDCATESDLTKKRVQFNEELMKAERELHIGGSYYAMAFVSGPCSICESVVCHEHECRRRTSGRMPICGTGIDLKWLASQVLDIPVNRALTYWKSNLAKKYFNDDAGEYMCLGMILI